MKNKKKNLQSEYVEVVDGLIDGLNGATRVTDEKQCRFGHVTTSPASDVEILRRSRAEGF